MLQLLTAIGFLSFIARELVRRFPIYLHCLWQICKIFTHETGDFKKTGDKINTQERESAA